MAYTTSDLLTSIKRNVTVPNSQIRFTDSDFLAMGDEQIMTLIMPMITSMRQEFFVKKSLTTVVAAQTEYKIPYRAVGRTLREIKVSNSDQSVIYTIPYVLPEDTQYFNYNNSTGDVRGYTVRGDNVVILPSPSSNTTQVLQIFYELAPSKLVTVSSCGQVATVNYNTGVVTLTSSVSGFSTGQSMDLVDGQSGNNVIAMDITNTGVSSSTINFNVSDLPAAPNALKAGDYVCLSNQTCVLPFPNEAFMVLVQAICCKILEAQGDFEGLQASEAKLMRNMEAFSQIITPRVEANVPTVVNTNGLIKNRLWRNWYYRYNL